MSPNVESRGPRRPPSSLTEDVTPRLADGKGRKPSLRRRYADGDPRQFLDERMLELLEQLDQIPYERGTLNPLEDA